MFRRFALFWGVAALVAASIVVAVPRNTLDEISNVKQTHRVRRLADEEVSNDQEAEAYRVIHNCSKKHLDQDEVGKSDRLSLII